MNMARIILLGALLMSLAFVYGNDTRRRREFCPWKAGANFSNTTSLCNNGLFLSIGKFCNGANDCGDNSDEYYCGGSRLYNCPPTWKYCGVSPRGRCVSADRFCDGTPDCPSGEDEQNCPINSASSSTKVLLKSLQWLQGQSKPGSSSQVWGSFVDKTAVALYFADPSFSTVSNGTRKEIAYEVSIKLLSKIFREKLQDIPSTDLASFVNAFLVSCLDPRKFHGLDIIQELRNRADNQSYTSPYVYLALCNAGETITESDQKKLIDTFWSKHRTFWTDIQALTVLALACASQQPGNNVDGETLRGLTMELKQHQYSNGSLGNLHTTALVLQALLAAEPDDDPDNFDENKALYHIHQNQKPDGSLGNLMNTYFLLPVLTCRSLVNISSKHCQSVSSDGTLALEDFLNRSGPKIRVQYSIWIGNKRDLERNLVLRIPANTSFYGIMETAAQLDSKFRFEYVVQNHMPYINAVSELQDNPEKGTFWFLYSIKDKEPTLIKDKELTLIKDKEPILINNSPAKVIPKNDDHFIMWYRSGSWAQ